MSAEVDVTMIPLSTVDEHRLVELETVIETGLETFVAVGTAISEIRDSKLYRATHDTLEAYLADRWQISRSRGYQLMTAARVSTIVDSAGLPTPENEAQARALAVVPDDQVPAVWQDTLDSVGPSGPTAQDVQNAVDRAAGPPGEPQRTRRRKPLPDAFRRKEREATKAVAAMTKMIHDNRWDDHHALLREACRSDVERLIIALEKVRAALDDGWLDPDLANPTFEVVIIKGSNTASVTVPKIMRKKIFSTLRDMGAKHQSRSSGEIQFPSRYAERLRDSLLAAHTVAEVVVQ